MDAICSHHIFCIGDATIPYARLSALCLEAQCPRRLRDNFQIYVHLDGLRQDPQRAAAWFRRSSRTEVTTGLFGIPPDEYVPGKWHQAMVNTVSTEFSQEPVVAFVDADCFVTDSSWFLTAQLHDPTRHYSLADGFRGDNRVLEHDGLTLRCIQTRLFTLTPALHNRICEQRFNDDASAVEKLLEQFPGVTVKLKRPIDNMVTASFKAQLLGYQIVNVQDRVRVVHVGGFSYMRVDKLQALQGEARDKWLRRGLSSRLLKYFARRGWVYADRISTQIQARDKWLTRVRFNSRLLKFFARLGWEKWIDPTYAAQIDEMEQFVTKDRQLDKRQRRLPPTRDEIGFCQRIEPMADVLIRAHE